MIRENTSRIQNPIFFLSNIYVNDISDFMTHNERERASERAAKASESKPGSLFFARISIPM